MSDWQPIETAPKDGTRILVWWPRGEVTVAYWRPTRNELVSWGKYREVQGCWEKDDSMKPTIWGVVTHWMPLPAPPTE